jgi:hypothetical protein
MNLRKKRTLRASLHYIGWRARQKSLLLPVAGEVFLLTLPFIERAYRPCGYWSERTLGLALSTHLSHTCPTHLCRRSPQRLSAVRTRRSVCRQHVVINGIRICFAETRDAFIFAQNRAEHSLLSVASRSRIAKGRDALKFVVVEHWYIHFASPAPEYFHRWPKVNIGTRNSNCLEFGIRSR